MSDFIQQQGLLGMISRLRHLSDLLQREQFRIQSFVGTNLEANWYLVITLLKQHERLSVSQIAKHLKISHPATVKILGRMKLAGLVVGEIDPLDRRKQIFSLSQQAKTLLPQFNRDAEILNEALKDAGASFLSIVLNEMEASLNKQSLFERFVELDELNK